MMEIMQFIITSLPTLNQGYDDTTKDSKFVILIDFFSSSIEPFIFFSRDTNLRLQLLLLKTVQKVC